MSGIALQQTSAPLRARVRRVPGLPVVSIRVWLRGGCLDEPRPGVSNLTGRLLVEGTASRGWEEIAGACEERGMVLVGFGGLEAHGLGIDALAQDWGLALGWAAELVAESRFPDERFDWLRRQAMAELDSLADQPEMLASWSFLRQLYDPNPAARPVLGERQALETLCADDCRAFHARALARGLVVSVAGDVDETTVERRIEELFSALVSDARAPDLAPAPPRGSGGPRREVQLPERDASRQAHLLVGHLTVPRVHSDFRALEAAGVVLGAGSGLTGRIPARVREREGLAYTAHAHTVVGAGLGRGRLVAYVATAPERVTRAESAVREEIERFVEQGIADEEMEGARTYLLRREPFLRETARQWAELMAESLFYGLPLDDVAAVRDEILGLRRPAVEAAVRRHVDPRGLKITVGLPP